jgi:hypothetical protein
MDAVRARLVPFVVSVSKPSSPNRSLKAKHCSGFLKRRGALQQSAPHVESSRESRAENGHHR